MTSAIAKERDRRDRWLDLGAVVLVLAVTALVLWAVPAPPQARGHALAHASARLGAAANKLSFNVAGLAKGLPFLKQNPCEGSNPCSRP